MKQFDIHDFMLAVGVSLISTLFIAFMIWPAIHKRDFAYDVCVRENASDISACNSEKVLLEYFDEFRHEYSGR